MARLVRWASDSRIRIEGDCIVLAIDLGLPFLLVNLEDLFELNDSLVVGVKLRDELAQLKLLEVHVQSLKHSLKVVDVD